MWFRKSAEVIPLVIYMLACQCNLGAVSAPEKMANKEVAAKSHPAKEKKQPAPLVEKYLIEGNLQEGETALLAAMKAHPANDQLRFGLGSLQFLQAVERLSQSLHKYGLGNGTLHDWHRMPTPSLPLPENANPAVLNYEDARNIARDFLEDLGKAEATLASIKRADMELPLHFGMIRLDLNGDGKTNDDESLWRLYAALDRSKNISADNAKDFYISFDRGDVHWLRGYCHMFMGVCELYLAHDTKQTFDCTAHLFFNKVNSPYQFLKEDNPALHNSGDILDLIALVHLINWPVSEPERMVAALHHFEDVTTQSKESWKWIMAEKDNDHEWLPNPQQTSVIPDVHVTQEMVDTWLNLMDQTKQILAGEVLTRFWRGSDGLGLNVRKMFTEAKTFDLVVFLQGPGAAPYLQKGPLIEEGTFNKLQHTFGNQFPGFALWFN